MSSCDSPERKQESRALACLQPSALHARAKVESLAHSQLCSVQVHLQSFRVERSGVAVALSRVCERSGLRCAQHLPAETPTGTSRRADVKTCKAYDGAVDGRLLRVNGVWHRSVVMLLLISGSDLLDPFDSAV